MSGLYDALPDAKDASKDAPAGWAANKGMQPRQQAVTPGILAPPPSLLRAKHAALQEKLEKLKAKPRGQAALNKIAPAAAAGGGAVVAPPVFSKASGTSLSAAVLDEYAPSRPNDYEDVMRRRERERVEREAKRKAEALAAERQREEEKRQQDLEEDARRAAASRNNLNVSGEEAFLRRGRPRGGDDAEEQLGGLGLVTAAPPVESGTGGGLSAAERMMQKMGWKEGQGLGKDKQGMTTPLVAKKTDGRAGIITNAAPKVSSAAAAAAAAAAAVSEQVEKRQKLGNGGGGGLAGGTPTKVLLLRNMVGPGEVDDELEDECAGEMVKYGQVMRVCIFEVTTPNYPPAESVRIFIEFQRTEEATKGVVDLDGRFFGGRVVRAGFYDEGKFERGDLAPFPGEFN